MKRFDSRILRFLLVMLPQTLSLPAYAQLSEYDYINHAKTVITSDALDTTTIYKFYNDHIDQDVSWGEWKWVHIKFPHEIFIDQLQFSFHDRTCLGKCKLEFEILIDDFDTDVEILDYHETLFMHKRTNILIIKRKDVYPRGAAILSEIKILSSTPPEEHNFSHPTVIDSKKERIFITHKLNGLSQQESRFENQLWNRRARLFRMHFQHRLEEYEIDRMEEVIDQQDHDRYCYNIESYLNTSDDSSIVRILYEVGRCDMREEYFAQRMKPSKRMWNEKIDFLGDTISYSSSESYDLLRTYVRNGNAWAGHAALHLCLMQAKEALGDIISLKNDQNVFAQHMALMSCLYFGEFREAKEICDSIISTELCSLRLDSVSVYGRYAVWALESMLEFYPEYSLNKLLELFETYRSTFPSETGLNANYWRIYRLLGNKAGERIQTIHDSDLNILNIVDAYYKRNSHLKLNSTGIQFEVYIAEKKAFIAAKKAEEKSLQ